MNAKKLICMIPARFGSRRFPGKPLALLKGKPIIEHVVKRAKMAQIFDEIAVISDNEEILTKSKDAGALAVLVKEECKSGTDRIFKALPFVKGDLIVNLQGDEPAIDLDLIRSISRKLKIDPAEDTIITSATPFKSWQEFQDENNVKVVTDAKGNALYFSRSPIPNQAECNLPKEALLHIGLYAMTRKTLERFASLPFGRLEKLERLEQLRALEYGIAIKVLLAPSRSIGVDMLDDLIMLETTL